MTDFNCGKDELRCLVPWRPWVKKYKEEWWGGKGAMKGAGKGRRCRNMHEMLPNMALEKHAWLGAGLMWKRMLATTTGVRKAQTPMEWRDQTPLKALPLIPVWDELFVATNHTEFQRHHGKPVLTETNGLTRIELDHIDPSMEHGMVIKGMDHPYLLSPPSLPVAGATSTGADTVKVMAFRGIVYSHGGLYDPAVMPEYV